MKSSESAYKKAYEKAKAQESQMAADESIVTETPVVTPLETKSASDANVTTVREYNSNDASYNNGNAATNNYSQYRNSTSDTENATYREESVTVVSGEGLSEFNVVVGSFSLKANAEGLQNELKAKGYNAQIAFNADRNMYRVIAATHHTKEDAVKSRNELRAGKYADAWLLFKK
jgi:cell division protein FtsN